MWEPYVITFLFVVIFLSLMVAFSRFIKKTPEEFDAVKRNKENKKNSPLASALGAGAGVAAIKAAANEQENHVLGNASFEILDDKDQPLFSKKIDEKNNKKIEPAKTKTEPVKPVESNTKISDWLPLDVSSYTPTKTTTTPISSHSNDSGGNHSSGCNTSGDSGSSGCGGGGGGD